VVNRVLKKSHGKLLAILYVDRFIRGKFRTRQRHIVVLAQNLRQTLEKMKRFDIDGITKRRRFTV